MKKRHKGPSETLEDKENRINLELDGYTVSFRDKVRFKDHDETITFGLVCGTNKDGSITLKTDYGTRCIMPEKLQTEEVKVGPRGGKRSKWISIIKK